MIRHEISRWLGMTFFRNFLIVNAGFALAGICYSLMFYRIYTIRNGRFRVKLLWHFGTGAIAYLLCALFWHPFFNEWLQFLVSFPHLIALIHLTHFIVAGGYYDHDRV